MPRPWPKAQRICMSRWLGRSHHVGMEPWSHDSMPMAPPAHPRIQEPRTQLWATLLPSRRASLRATRSVLIGRLALVCRWSIGRLSTFVNCLHATANLLYCAILTVTLQMRVSHVGQALEDDDYTKLPDAKDPSGCETHRSTAVHPWMGIQFLKVNGGFGGGQERPECE